MSGRIRIGPGGRRNALFVLLPIAVGAALFSLNGPGSPGRGSLLDAGQSAVAPVAPVVPDGVGTVPPTSPPTTSPTIVGAPTAAGTGPTSTAASGPPASTGTGTTTTLAVARNPDPQDTTQGPAAPGQVAPATTSAPSPTSPSTTTTRLTAPAAVRTGPGRSAGVEAQVVGLTNGDRGGTGLGALTRNACLDSLAAGYAEAMFQSGVLAHNPKAGPAVMGCRANATWGDNVGTAGPCDAALVEREWMASPTHRENILGTAFQFIGVGAWSNDLGTCWIQVLFSS